MGMERCAREHHVAVTCAVSGSLDAARATTTASPTHKWRTSLCDPPARSTWLSPPMHGAWSAHIQICSNAISKCLSPRWQACSYAAMTATSVSTRLHVSRIFRRGKPATEPLPSPPPGLKPSVICGIASSQMCFQEMRDGVIVPKPSKKLSFHFHPVKVSSIALFIGASNFPEMLILITESPPSTNLMGMGVGTLLTRERATFEVASCTMR
mmetsp:Transcript_59639/g.122319  ORF Transcript_59639/g.122319 Transcript_59639/m.122319 type:complete len:211 (-) Transcript_59639:404-1036(-)